LAREFRAGASPVRGRWRRGRGASASLCPRFWPQRARKSAPQPEIRGAAAADFPQGQPVEVVEGYPPRQGSDVCRSSSGEALPRTRKRAPRGRSASTRSVGKNVGAALNLVEHHQATQGFQRQQGIGELGQVAAGFEVKKRDAGPVAPGDLACQGRPCRPGVRPARPPPAVRTAGGEPRRHGAVVRSSAIRLPGYAFMRH